MRKYNVSCPCCGHENRELFLDETDGWLVCDGCGLAMQVPEPERGAIRILSPVRPVA